MPLAPLFLQVGVEKKVQKSRKQIKEKKNRSKKVRGVKKARFSRQDE